MLNRFCVAEIDTTVKSSALLHNFVGVNGKERNTNIVAQRQQCATDGSWLEYVLKIGSVAVFICYDDERDRLMGLPSARRENGPRTVNLVDDYDFPPRRRFWKTSIKMVNQELECILGILSWFFDLRSRYKIRFQKRNV